mgnify:CR=1 FL=1
MGEGQCEEFPSIAKLAKKCKRKKWKKNNKKRTSSVDNAHAQLHSRDWRCVKGDFPVVACKFWGPCVEKSKRGVDKRWRLVRSVWQVNEGYKWGSCPWLCLVWITRCSLPHHVSKGCHTVNRLPCLDEKVFFFFNLIVGSFSWKMRHCACKHCCIG